MYRSVIEKINILKIYNKFVKDAKIKTKLLTGFIVLACIPLLITGFMAYSRASTVITDEINSFSVVLTNQVAKEISTEIVGLETEVMRILTLKETNSLLYEYLLSKDENKWSIAQELRMIMSDSSFSQRTDISTLLLDSELNIIHMSFYPNSENEEIFKVSEINDILRSTNDYRTFIEGIGTFRNEKVPLIIKPVTWYLDNSRILGYHVIAFDKEFLKKVYKSVNFGENSSIFVMNGSGILVSGSDSKDFVGEELTKRKAYLLQEDNKISTKDLMTKDSLITFSNIMKTGWFLVSEIPISSLTKESRELGLFIIIIVIGCLFCAIMVSVFLSKQIALPLTYLVTNMKEAESGNLNTAIDVVDRNDEIGDVTRGFKNMIAKIRMLIKNIEDQNIQLSTAFDELKKAQKRIVESEKLAALGKLVAGVAHEINTPVGVSMTAASVIKSKAKLIKEIFQSGNIKKSEFESFIMSCDDSSSIILNDLDIATKIIKSFKQIAADQDEEEKRVFDVKEYLNQIFISIGPTLKNTKHSIEIKCEDDLRIISYPGAMYQILSNLIINSINHAYDENVKGDIIIEVTKNDADLILRYSDDGIGISRENLKDIYEPFFTTKRGRGSVGLGLSIVYNIVYQVLKGSITCESSLGEGTTFTIIIPDAVRFKSDYVEEIIKE